MTANIRNHSTGCLEGAKQIECPRCEGAGHTKSDLLCDAGACRLCGGYGAVWQSTQGTGWYRRVGDKLTHSFHWNGGQHDQVRKTD